MKVAIYARVSTEEKNTDNQVGILTEWARSRGWEVDGSYGDVGSAFQHADQKGLRQLLIDCDHGRYQQVPVYDLSRLTRQGPLEMMLLLKQFADKGAPVHSYLDSAINVPSEFQPVLIAFYGMMAKLFSTQLSERTKAGMARAKAEGKHVGRPAKSVYYDPNGGLHWHRSLSCPMVADSPHYRTIGYAELKKQLAPDGKPYRLCPFCRLVKKGLVEEYNTLLDTHSRLKKLME